MEGGDLREVRASERDEGDIVRERVARMVEFGCALGLVFLGAGMLLAPKATEGWQGGVGTLVMGLYFIVDSLT